MKLFGIFDKKVGEYQARLMVTTNEAVLARGMKNAFQKGRDAEADYPEDFDVYELGSLDMRTGVVDQSEFKFRFSLTVLYQEVPNA